MLGHYWMDFKLDGSSVAPIAYAGTVVLIAYRYLGLTAERWNKRRIYILSLLVLIEA